MPRTKPETDREQKRGEIVAAVRALFLRDGYDATAVSGIASEAGVASTTLYWFSTTTTRC